MSSKRARSPDGAAAAERASVSDTSGHALLEITLD